MNTTENKKLYYTDYYTAATWFGGIIMCNNINEIDPSIFENFENLPVESDDDDESEEEYYPEIYQYFLTPWSKQDVELILEVFPDLIITYSDRLDLYVLCVDHYGTMWSGVPTLTTIEYAHTHHNAGKRLEPRPEHDYILTLPSPQASTEGEEASSDKE